MGKKGGGGRSFVRRSNRGAKRRAFEAKQNAHQNRIRGPMSDFLGGLGFIKKCIEEQRFDNWVIKKKTGYDVPWVHLSAGKLDNDLKWWVKQGSTQGPEEGIDYFVSVKILKMDRYPKFEEFLKKFYRFHKNGYYGDIWIKIMPGDDNVEF